ncbi:uncharacterized protein A4U43_C01F35200 [Asparagus officinalis]|uniref:Pentacotripeptide-repeat region of PRORP domain-containing protein n=1 Tax=Asparagus officinalis TaxID=4686 RepID=A0A5P1FXP4_ASPOF|nr:pentatricopeptide repeat-containing protein At5g15980, mitochondrial-like [Asparagus officinalis]ONK82010.1 uncharacterized protein A4U43_C01F35200 [Asparagus officinalis]
MKSAWRLLFNRSLPRPSSPISTLRAPNLQVRSSQLPNPRFPPSFNPGSRHFSSDPALDQNRDQNAVLLTEIFSKSNSFDEIKTDLDHETVHSVLRNLEESPEKAKRFFDWVLEREVKENRLIRSKSFNLMLEISVKKGETNEFWGLVKIMEEKGYRIEKGAYLKVSERFKNDGLEEDLKRLEELYSMKSPHILASRIYKMLLREKEEESEVVLKKLQDLGIDLSSDLVVSALDQLSAYPNKALMFFQWIEENPSFEMDARVSNAMARVLGREDCIDKFWEILQKMKNSGFQIERETLVKVLDRFIKRRMISQSVELYAFAMGRSENPQLQDFLFLLKKVLVSKDLNLSLVSNVVQAYISAANVIRGSTFDGVLKSLRSVGRLGECDKILKAMEGGGFVADANVYGNVVAGLCDAKKLDEALEYADNLEKSGKNLDLNTWSSLVKKSSLTGNFDKALACLKKMVERKGGDTVGCAFEVLIHELCQKKSDEYALKVLKEMVTKRNVKPWHTTYKFLIERLVNHGKVKEASSLLELMKSDGFPPYIDPFVGYVSRSGSADDAMIFLKAMKTNEFPSTSVFLRVFEALFKEGRHQIAHDLFSLSPGRVKNHADVLDLFYSMKQDEADTAAAL